MLLTKEASKEKLRGGFYTPKEIADFMLKWAVNGNNEMDILEPSCGDGIFLQLIQENNIQYSSLTAIEFDEIEYDKFVIDIVNQNLKDATGRIKNNPKAEALWKRSYQPGWEPTI